MFFDAVVTKNLEPVFNGTPEQTREWLETTPEVDHLYVCVGISLAVVPVAKYLSKQQGEQ